MKNDFEFIKDKMDHSGVNAPANMDEDFVLNRLEGVQPNADEPKVTEFRQKKRRAALITGLAAAFVAVVTLSIFGVMRFGKNIPSPAPRSSPVSVKEDIPLKAFASYDELRAQTKELAKKYPENYYFSYGSAEAQAGASADGDSANTGISGGSPAPASHSETYRQVAGVDEADSVKTDGRYLYIIEKGGTGCVRIFSATDDPVLVATIYPTQSDDPTATPDESEDTVDGASVQEIFLYDEKLILTCMVNDGDFAWRTTACVYDVSDPDHITILDRFNQSGWYRTSRMIGDTLYLISDYGVNDENFEIPVCYCGATPAEIPIDCVYSAKEPVNNDMLIVGGYSLSDSSADVRTTAVVGAVEDVYCNESNMYIYSTEWNTYYMASRYAVYEQDDNGSDIVPPFEPIKTGIYKISLKGDIAFTAYGQVEGILDSRYSLDEKDGYLRVAATTEDKFWKESNRLYILDSTLKEVGRTEDFAKTESIKAVRYVGDTAYVITYEQTDPLFVIDVGDPASPKILGEVKIDGFSSMLVPVDENTVLGLGYYTEDSDEISMQVQSGFKLALFDVSDKMAPKVLDEKIYRNHYSEVMYEPRALVYNPERGDYLIPLNFEDYHFGSDIDYYMPDIRGGALNFKVQDSKLVEISHPEINTDNSEADLISRCLYVGDTIYLISNDYYEKTNVYTAEYR